MDEDTRIRLIELTADVVSAYVSNNSVPIGELASLIGNVHAMLTNTAGNVVPEKPKEPLNPAVPIRKSVHPDFIISLEDGRKFRSLKRHLMTHYGMTPDDYRAKWGGSPRGKERARAYSNARSALAKTMGLGRKAKTPPAPA